jgi:hypothetical protein
LRRRAADGDIEERVGLLTEISAGFFRPFPDGFHRNRDAPRPDLATQRFSQQVRDRDGAV